MQISEKGKVTPHGVYDIGGNPGWVSVGIDPDTAEFAVDSIRPWWKRRGQPRYPEAQQLLIPADSGGSNSYRARLWKGQLQKLANETGLSISVCHFPPGTSQWNEIEHRMFCHITSNWRGRPLESREVEVNLIANTQTSKVLTIQAGLNFTLTTDLGDVDVLGEVAGIGTYDQVLARSVEKDSYGLTIRVLSVDGLIAAKTAAGRLKDRNHILELIELKKLKDANPGE